MNKSNFRVSKKVCFVVLVAIITLTFNSLVFATTATNCIQSAQRWGIGEYEEGGSAIIPCTANCLVRVTCEYVKPQSTMYSISKQSVFACAQNWNGVSPYYSYDLVVTASPKITYNSGSTSLGYQSLSYDGNVLVDPNWIWDCRSKNTTVTFPYSPITASSYGTFWAPDAVILPPLYLQPSTRTIDVSVNF